MREEGVDTGRDVWLKRSGLRVAQTSVMRRVGLVDCNYYWNSRGTSEPGNPWTADFGGLGRWGRWSGLVWSGRNLLQSFSQSVIHSFIRNGAVLQ